MLTPDQRKPFDVVAVTEHAVIVLPHKTHTERPIHRTGIEKAYRRLVVTGKLTRSELPDGKRHWHQRRIPGRVLERARICLLNANLAECKTFSQLIE